MSLHKMISVAIGLGANLQGPAGMILAAVAQLRAGGLTQVRLSSLYQTPAENCLPETPPFVNGALTGIWGETPEQLLALTRRIERDLGRPPAHSSREARVIDLDLLLFGSRRIATPDLVIPHPRMTRRGFVLVPLAELAADWVIPGTGLTVGTALRDLAAQGGRTAFPVVCYAPPNL